MESLGNPNIKLTLEEREMLIRLFGSVGLYDASQDDYQVTEHPEDDQWIVRGQE